jgi:isopentenyl diphosphate isomerase/L-lactate dehydrogenase-like FMN-dependent dehydrogenase
MDIDHFYGLIIGDRVMRTELFGPQPTQELKQLISQSKLPFIIKGVLSITDAKRATELGASAIVVSNHGSGSFYCTIPSMIALPTIAKSVANKSTVLVDTSFETGNDVFKALASGAEGVGFGKSVILAAAANGAQGVELLIRLLTEELQRAMAATGCTDLSSITKVTICQLPL